jgi:alpha-tubulin suppressor-like RCC1 family protein
MIHGLALRQDGTVWAWGNNYYGQLGNGAQGGTSLPQPVQGQHGLVAVAAGLSHSLALRRDGSLWTWGHNIEGAMGTGTHRRTSPTPVDLKDVRAVASTYSHTLAVRGDGSVWQWGSMDGWGGSIQAAPTRVQGLTGGVAVAVGTAHSVVVRQDGTVWAWGDNSRGQLGDGTVGERRDTPARVQGLDGVVAVAAGEYHSLALKQDGTVWAWGANHFSQLGDMTLEDQLLPVQVQGLQGVSAISASFDFSVAVLNDGTVWQWGSDWSVWYWGDMTPRLPEPVPELSEVVKVSVLFSAITALRADGTVWQWFLSPPWESIPAWQVEGLSGAVDMVSTASTTQLLLADGTVWNIGGNHYGERGFPSSEPYSLELKQVPGLTQAVSLSSGFATVFALRADGTLLAWGSNRYGTIGDGVSPVHLQPARVLLPCKLKGLGTGQDVREQQQCHAEP